mmetsp:Transcript_20460/g.52145  ORF Transcript_20460/g.52145 Transcript_20460/m.52145 type:complete len:436 (-) Transcript_20460:8-1315(-)
MTVIRAPKGDREPETQGPCDTSSLRCKCNAVQCPMRHSSEALPVHDGGAGLVVLALGDPHLLEGAEGGEDGAADPDGVLALRRGHDLDLHGGGRQGCELLGHALADASEHRRAAREHHVGVEVLADVNITLHDGLEGRVMDAAGLLAHEARLEEHLRAAEALAAHRDDVAIRQLVGLLLVRALRGRLHLRVEVQRDVAELLLHIANNLTLRSRGEGVAALREDLHQVLREVPTREVQTQDGVRQRVALVDGHGVGHTIAGVHDNARGAARGVQRKHGLDCHVHGRHVEGLKHDLRHALTVRLRVQRGLREQHWVLLRRHAQLVVERVVPDLLHVIPVRDNAMLNGVLQGQHSALALRLVTHVALLLVHAHHDAWHLRTAHNRGEDGPRGIVTGEASLAHAAAVVHDERRNLLVGHGCKYGAGAARVLGGLLSLGP